MKRKEVFGHQLRYLHISDGQFKINEERESKNTSLWYVCKVCNLEIYWSDELYDNQKNPYT